MRLYAVRVFVQGTQQGGLLFVTARSALDAMNEVETRLGLKPPSAYIDKETGKMLVTDWHGYEFKARQVASPDKHPPPFRPTRPVPTEC